MGHARRCPSRITTRAAARKAKEGVAHRLARELRWRGNLHCRVFVFPAPFVLRMHLCFGLFVLNRIYRRKLGGGAALVAGTTFREIRSMSLEKWQGFFGNESGGRLKNPRGLW
jgi:hypothetical protein